MVSKTSICYGHFDGIQTPVIPKAPRSLRTNVSEKSSEGSAFELLADVADRLLQESEGSISSVGHEPKEQNSDTVVKCEEPEVKVKHVDEGSCAESEFMPECVGVKPLYQNRKHIYKRERCQVDTASKRRKVFHQSSKNAYIQGAVKVSINSFKVPELYFEIPETATIGSLKTTVMNAVKDKLGGKLHVGILLEGKKVRDNNRTLQQMGISHKCDLGTLGFTLEPSFLEASPSPIQQEPPLSSASPITDVGYSNSSLYHDLETYLDNYVDKNQESITKKPEVLTEEKVADSKALVPVTAVTTKALSDILVNYNPTKKSEVSQRRIRRPFSKSEVEALVEAVEFLGPGRWREVKMRAFDDAEHRTCVDLKDKWKTLAHTASIPPHQRRGELVPQHLLDRVLAAHEYWSNYQIKHGLKRQSEPLRILM